MAVRFLSEEWAKEVTRLLQASESVQAAARGQTTTVQQVITDVPEAGEVKYYLRLIDGVPEVVIGEAEGAEATVTQTYDTAASIDKGQLNAQAAFMQGKLKIQGNLMKLMQLQGFLQALGPAMGSLEREY